MMITVTEKKEIPEAVVMPSTPESANLIVVPVAEVASIDELSPTTGMQPNRPSWMKDDEEAKLRENLKEFVSIVKSNPTDVGLAMQVYQLGESGAKELMPHTALYEKKITDIMHTGGTESPVNKNLLQLKQTIDLVNPSVVEKQPIPYKVALFFTKNKLPGSQEVLNIISERRETIMSTITGLKEGLWEMKDTLLSDMNDLVAIYNGLLKGQRLIEKDVYFGQLLHGEIQAFLNGITDEISRQNIEQLLADLTSQIINLQTEENANMQFFAGAQAMAKLTRQQVQNISGLSRLLERTVLANLGLRAVAGELGRSLSITEQMKQTIGETLADTGKQINQYGDQLNNARSQAMINLSGLEKGCVELEEFFTKQAVANRQIIDVGIQTSRQLSGMTSRMRKRVEGGHDNIGKLAGSDAPLQIASQKEEK